MRIYISYKMCQAVSCIRLTFLLKSRFKVYCCQVFIKLPTANHVYPMIQGSPDLIG
jgi:hypothetical protein